jgi:hypothetical protein
VLELTFRRMCRTARSGERFGSACLPFISPPPVFCPRNVAVRGRLERLRALLYNLKQIADKTRKERNAPRS